MSAATASSFKSDIATAVQELGFQESNWASPMWMQLGEQVDQDTLNDAFNQAGIVNEIFSSLGEVSQRNRSKALERVRKKMADQPERKNYFKTISDFIAVRVACEVTEIQEKTDRLKEIVKKNGGAMHIKGSSEERLYGFFMHKDKTFADITLFAYVFLPAIGYPMEFQINHRFAGHTFEIDSERRDNRDCGKVDLWDNDFYPHVKAYLLAQANGTPSGSKDDLIKEALKLHQVDRFEDLPEDLQTILATIK